MGCSHGQAPTHSGRTHRREVFCALRFLPTGFVFATGEESSQEDAVRLWNAHTGEHVRMLLGHSAFVMSICLLARWRNTLASGSADRMIRLWDAHTGEYRHTLYGHTNAINSVAFSPDGLTLASGSLDDTIRLWDAHTERTQAHLRGTFDVSQYHCIFS